MIIMESSEVFVDMADCCDILFLNIIICLDACRRSTFWITTVLCMFHLVLGGDDEKVALDEEREPKNRMCYD
jgi:hypothetical protein